MVVTSLFYLMSSINFQRSEKLQSLMQSKLGDQLLNINIELGDLVAHVSQEKIYDFLKILKLDAELKFNLFVSVTAIDWIDAHSERFELVYHLLSTENLFRIRVKVAIPESKLEVASVVGLWSGANFMEREVWDMYGIVFVGHPELKRILMYDEFIGHPLRKDYPLQAKQPRIQMRYPEVQNTARNMIRPDLISIGGNKSKKTDKDKNLGR